MRQQGGKHILFVKFSLKYCLLMCLWCTRFCLFFSSQYNLSLPPFYSPSEQLPFICSHDNKHGMLRCRDIPPWVQNGTTCLVPPHYKASLRGQLMPSLGPDDCYDLNNFYNVCRHSDQNPYMGNINFDNIGYAWISLFQVRGTLVFQAIN